jgi:hypothetical protein
MEDSHALTPRQLDLVTAIYDLRTKHGYSPTYEEVGRVLGCNKTTVFGHVRELIGKGALMKVHNSPVRNLIVHPDLIRMLHKRSAGTNLRDAAQTLVHAAERVGAEYRLTEEAFAAFCAVLSTVPDHPQLSEHLERISLCPPTPQA